MRTAFVFLLLSAAFFGTDTTALGQPRPRLDVYGESLPQGALARMGTIQFRHPWGVEKMYLSDPSIPVTFSPDGRIMATAWADRVRLWQAGTGKFLLEIKTAGASGFGHIFSPDGRFLAVPLVPKTGGGVYVGLWDVKTGKLRHRFPSEKGIGPYVRHVLFSPDGQRLAATEETHKKGAIHVWDTNTGKEIAVLSSGSPKIGSFTWITALAFSPDGKTLVVLPHLSNKIWHWDFAKGEIRKIVSLEAQPKSAQETYDWQFSKDGGTLACRFTGDGIVRLIDTATGKTRCRLPKLAHHRLVGFAAEDRLFVTAEYKDNPDYVIILSLCDSKTGQLKHQFKIPRQSGFFTFSPDGSRMAFGGWYIRLYDVASGKELLTKPSHKGHVYSLAFTPDGGTLLSGGADGAIGIWDAATGKNRHFLRGNRWMVMGVALVPGGSTFVTCGQDGLIRLFDWRSGKEIRRFGFTPEGKQPFQQVRVSGDGKTVISQVFTAPDSKNAPFHVWDLEIGKLLRSFPKHGGAELSTLTAEGKHVLGVRYLTQNHSSYMLQLRELAVGRLLFALGETDSSKGWATLTIANGRFLIYDTYRKNAAIHLRELATGKDRLTIESNEEGPQCYFEQIALSPNGRILAAAKANHVLHFWDLRTGQELPRRLGYDESVSAMTFSSDGNRLATSHADGTILVWDVSQPKENPSPLAPSAKELEAWWKDLAGEDAAQAHRAIANLVGAPKQAVALFKDRLRPAADQSDRIPQLLAQLDDNQFAVRQMASHELERLGVQAEPALRRALRQNPSLEMRLRIERILARPALLVRDAELLRAIRAVEVLEYLAEGADASRFAARDLLTQLASGAAEARLTQEAKAARRRATRSPSGRD